MRCVVKRVVPNRYAAEALGELRVRCPRVPSPPAAPAVPPPETRKRKARTAAEVAAAADGCAWTGTLSALETHAAECALEPVACPNAAAGCTATVARRDLSAHAAACPRREVTCPHCESEGFAEDLSKHLTRCHDAPVTCTNAGCGASCARRELPTHRAACPHEEVACPVPGCIERCARSALSAHLVAAQATHLIGLCSHVAVLTRRLSAAEARVAATEAHARAAGLCGFGVAAWPQTAAARAALAADTAQQRARAAQLARRVQDAGGAEAVAADEEADERVTTIMGGRIVIVHTGRIGGGQVRRVAEDVSRAQVVLPRGTQG
jgi:hypothetical protein